MIEQVKPSKADMVRLHGWIFDNAVKDILTRLIVDARETTLDAWGEDAGFLVDGAQADIKAALKELMAVVAHAV